MADGWQVLVAWNNNALDDLTAITTVAAAGNPTTNTPPTVGAHNVWTDISQYVSHISYTRGRQHELARFEAGTATIDLVNNTGDFYPWDTGGPFYGLLLPMKPLQIRRTYLGVVYKRFTGYITAYPQQWPNVQTAAVRLTASDGFRQLALANITNLGYSGQVLSLAPQAYYRFGEVLGATTAPDSSGNGLNATYAGYLVEGVSGALLADPNTAVRTPSRPIAGAIPGVDAVALPSGAGLTAASSVSFETWVRFVATPYTSNNHNLWYRFDTVSTINVFLGIDASGHVTLHVRTTGVSGWSNDAHTTYPTTNLDFVTDGNWHHIVGTQSADGLTAVGYVDGVAVCTTTAGHAVVFPGLASTSNVIGPQNTENTNGIDYDEAAIYLTTLTAAQVLANYTYGKSGLIGQNSGQRINSILSGIGWPQALRSVVTSSGSTLQDVTAAFPNGTKCLSHGQLVEQTEAGALLMSGDGKVRFESRTSIALGSTASAVTFGDGTGEQPYQPMPDFALDDIDIWNEATYQRNGGSTQQWDDATSQGQYGVRTLSKTGLLNTTDAESLNHAQYDVNRYAQPLTRVRRVLLRLTGLPTLLPTILALDMLSRVTFARHSPPGGGTALSQDALLEGMAENYDVHTGDWTMELRMSPTDATTYWILGDSTYGVLGSTTRLSF